MFSLSGSEEDTDSSPAWIHRLEAIEIAGLGICQQYLAHRRLTFNRIVPFSYQVRAAGKDRKHRKPLNEWPIVDGSSSLLNETYDLQRPTLSES